MTQPPDPESQALPPNQHPAWEKKGTRSLAWGAVWLIGGLLITLYTYSEAAASEFGGVYIVAWGPMLYGLFRLITGAVYLYKSRH